MYNVEHFYLQTQKFFRTFLLVFSELTDVVGTTGSDLHHLEFLSLSNLRLDPPSV